MGEHFITTASKTDEKTTYGKIYHNYDKSLNPVEVLDSLESLLAIKEVFIKPGSGVLPYQCENILKVVIPIEGECAERSNNLNNSVVTKGKVQLIKYPEGAKLMEYNPHNEIELCYVIFKFSAPSTNYSCEIFDMLYEENDLRKILSTPLNNESEECLNLHTGNYKNKQRINYTFDSKAHGLFIYVLEGSLKTANSLQALQPLEMIILHNQNEVNLEVFENTKFIILELIKDVGNLCELGKTFP
jgi:hypothetical protein